ncbi:MAG: hypothetical protein ACKOZV_07370, partial [Bacteroidota bacterium]
TVRRKLTLSSGFFYTLSGVFFSLRDSAVKQNHFISSTLDRSRTLTAMRNVSYYFGFSSHFC